MNTTLQQRIASFSGTIRARAGYLWYIYRDLWLFVSMALVGFVTIVLGYFWHGASVGFASLIGLAVAIVSAFSALLYRRNIKKKWTNVQLQRRDVVDVMQDFGEAGVIELQDAGKYGVSELLWRDPSIDETLQQGAGQIEVVVADEAYALPGDLRSIAPRAFRSLANQSSPDTPDRLPRWFNGKLTRLASDPSAFQAEPLKLESVRFFDGQASNEQLPWCRTDATEDRSVIHQHLFDNDGDVLNLASSGLANMVGISVLAITTDGYVLFVQQGASNSVQSSGYAASGSGSLDWSDTVAVHKRCQKRGENMTLHELLTAGMQREMREESQVHRDEIVDESQVVTGYSRWLSRGAKPEFSGLVKLNVAMADVIERAPGADEAQYSVGRGWVPVDVLLADADTWGERHDALRQSLARHHRDTSIPEDLVLGVSTMAAWCAAADFVAANRWYVEGLGDVEDDTSDDALNEAS
ncbi:hypothetical protein GCM10009720_16170 [Yaniella flava]|uniref:Nudix hydrolase domain-containing protein n=1 Tax=Yaniella flava TaxID=287930 RepID=A0ABN2UHT7_9MICC|nr:DUF805 domain-containing protein [Micrococcaceae bacterium]